MPGHDLGEQVGEAWGNIFAEERAGLLAKCERLEANPPCSITAFIRPRSSAARLEMLRLPRAPG